MKVIPGKSSILSILSLVCPALVFAQIDTAYIQTFEQPLDVKVYMSQHFVGISTGEENYMPNNPVNLGVGISLKNTILSLNMGLPVSKTLNPKAGKSDFMDIQFHNYGRYFIFDLFFQRYQGFYTEGEKQKKSVGSLMAGVGVSYSQIDSDIPLLNDEEHNLGEFNFGFSAGYAYSWAMNEKWLLSGALTAGIHAGRQKSWVVYPVSTARFSVGYNRPDWAISLLALNNSLFSASSREHTGLISGTVEMVYLKRINFPRLW